MKPRNWWNIENTNTEGDKTKAITLFLKDVYNILNKGGTLSDNFKGTILDVEFLVANTDTAFRHGLDFVPTNYIQCGATVSMQIYDGTTVHDQTFIYLKSNAIGLVRIFVF